MARSPVDYTCSKGTASPSRRSRPVSRSSPGDCTSATRRSRSRRGAIAATPRLSHPLRTADWTSPCRRGNFRDNPLARLSARRGHLRPGAQVPVYPAERRAPSRAIGAMPSGRRHAQPYRHPRRHLAHEQLGRRRWKSGSRAQTDDWPTSMALSRSRIPRAAGTTSRTTSNSSTAPWLALSFTPMSARS